MLRTSRPPTDPIAVGIKPSVGVGFGDAFSSAVLVCFTIAAAIIVLSSTVNFSVAFGNTVDSTVHLAATLCVHCAVGRSYDDTCSFLVGQKLRRLVDKPLA